MIVIAHIKFSIGTTFLDNFFTAEDERLPGESIEDGVLRVRKHLENAVAILKKEKGEANGSDLPPHLKTEITYGPAPVIEIQTEKVNPNDTLSLIQNAPNLDVLKTFKLIASGAGPFYNAYCKRIKELSNGK
jgi:hypothetical protein